MARATRRSRLCRWCASPGPLPPHSARTLALTLVTLTLALAVSLTLALTLSLTLTPRCARCATRPWCGCRGKAAPHWAAAWLCDVRSMAPIARCRLGARVAVPSCSTTRRCLARTPRSGGRRVAGQHGQSRPIGSARQCPSSAGEGPASRISATASQLLERAASKVADSTAPGHPGVCVADKPGSFNGTFLRLSADREPSRPYPLELGDAFGLGCVGPGGLGHWLTLVAEEGEHYLQAR